MWRRHGFAERKVLFTHHRLLTIAIGFAFWLTASRLIMRFIVIFYLILIVNSSGAAEKLILMAGTEKAPLKEPFGLDFTAEGKIIIAEFGRTVSLRSIPTASSPSAPAMAPRAISTARPSRQNSTDLTTLSSPKTATSTLRTPSITRFERSMPKPATSPPLPEPARKVFQATTAPRPRPSLTRLIMW